ncbi:MAG: hypothetical protein OHK0022_54930 [Roseiflexaceae bacterium]
MHQRGFGAAERGQRIAKFLPEQGEQRERQRSQTCHASDLARLVAYGEINGDHAAQDTSKKGTNFLGVICRMSGSLPDATNLFVRD